MATFVFLHGSFHAAWNWHRVLPLLRAAGHEGVALDLPGHGRDRTPARAVSMERCVDSVAAALARVGEPAVLVAHSRNGIVASQTAERCPERIEGLVYLAAYLVPHGKSLMDYALWDEESLVLRNVAPRLDRRRAERLNGLFRSRFWRATLPALLPRRLQTHRLQREAVHDALYHDCPPEITDLAHALLEAEPNWAGFTPLALTPGRYGSVPKVYVECLQDRAVTPMLQRRMQRDTPCDAVFKLDTDHSPFFGRPRELADTLVRSLDVFAQKRGRAPLRLAHG